MVLCDFKYYRTQFDHEGNRTFLALSESKSKQAIETCYRETLSDFLSANPTYPLLVSCICADSDSIACRDLLRLFLDRIGDYNQRETNRNGRLNKFTINQENTFNWYSTALVNSIGSTVKSNTIEAWLGLYDAESWAADITGELLRAFDLVCFAPNNSQYIKDFIEVLTRQLNAIQVHIVGTGEICSRRLRCIVWLPYECFDQLHQMVSKGTANQTLFPFVDRIIEFKQHLEPQELEKDFRDLSKEDLYKIKEIIDQLNEKQQKLIATEVEYKYNSDTEYSINDNSQRIRKF